MKTKLVLVSGGMDSTVLLASVLQMTPPEEVLALGLRYGSLHQGAENQAAARVALHYRVERRVEELPRLGGSALTGDSPLPLNRSLEEMEKGGVAPSYVPARNSVFLSVAASIADAEGIKEIYYGAHREDHVGYPDCRPEFVDAMARALALGTKHQVKLAAPFIQWSKSDVVRFGIRLGVPFEITHSCYRGLTPPCNECDTCQIRRLAFVEAGLIDPLLAGAR